MAVGLMIYWLCTADKFVRCIEFYMGLILHEIDDLKFILELWLHMSHGRKPSSLSYAELKVWPSYLYGGENTSGSSRLGTALDIGRRSHETVCRFLSVVVV